MDQIRFLLADIQSPINLAQILRTCEAFNHSLVFIHDPRKLFSTHAATIHDFSCGSSDRLKLEFIDQLKEFLQTYARRKVATYLDDKSTPLHQFEFMRDDLVILGNEYTGLEERLVDLCDEKLVIELPPGYIPKSPSFQQIDISNTIRNDVMSSLNVAASAAIIAYKNHIT